MYDVVGDKKSSVEVRKLQRRKHESKHVCVSLAKVKVAEVLLVVVVKGCTRLVS